MASNLPESFHLARPALSAVLPSTSVAPMVASLLTRASALLGETPRGRSRECSGTACQRCRRQVAQAARSCTAWRPHTDLSIHWRILRQGVARLLPVPGGRPQRRHSERPRQDAAAAPAEHRADLPGAAAAARELRCRCQLVTGHHRHIACDNYYHPQLGAASTRRISALVSVTRGSATSA